jgi:hypothetical protein
VSNHPITPQASSQVNHDQVRSDLIEPEAMLANGEVHQLADSRLAPDFEHVPAHRMAILLRRAVGPHRLHRSVSGKPLVPPEFDVCADIRGFAPEVFGKLKPFLKSRKPPVDPVFR